MVSPLDNCAGPELSGHVLRIEKASIHDGDGLRTVVFLKGCPLRCLWCSTPESQRCDAEFGYVAANCGGCRKCIEVCPEGVFSLSDQGGLFIDRSRCRGCLSCVDVCPNGALIAYGKKMLVTEVVEAVSRDEIFYFHSGGGVTISGGECLLQADFVAAVLAGCRDRGIDTAIETSLYVSWSEMKKILPWLSAIYVDIKHGDNLAHKACTGGNASLVYDNLRKLDELKLMLPLHLRLPLVPGVNDDNESLGAIVTFAAGLSRCVDLEVLPYHRLGVETYSRLGRPYDLAHVEIPERKYLRDRLDYLRSFSPPFPVKLAGCSSEF